MTDFTGMSVKILAMRARGSRGQALAALSVLFSALVILPLGLLGYEYCRMVCAQQQLRSVCDAASLAGAAELASVEPENGNIAEAQDDAMRSAANIFRRNSIMGVSLIDAEMRYNDPPTPTDPPANTAVVFVDLLNSNGQPVSLGMDAGSMKLSAYYGYEPSFGRLINVQHVTISAVSSGGLVAYDIALCFDISGSIDDETPVTLVKRYWDGGKVAYDVPAGAQGQIFNVLHPSSSGTRVNGLGPQNLTAASYQGSTRYGGIGNLTPFLFTESPTSEFPTNQMSGLRANLNVGSVTAGSEVGCPPGNYDPSVPSSKVGNGINPDQTVNAFTDLVVNLDGNEQFQGWTSPDGFAFPNVATLVEAARGNLDLTPEQFKVSQGGSDANVSAQTLPPPRAGYQAAYRKRASELLAPLAQAKEAAKNFVASMRTNADAHFSIVAFTDGVGKGYDSLWIDTGHDFSATDKYVDDNWAPGGTGAFALPMLHLNDSGNSSDNYQASMKAISSLVPCGMTNLRDAIKVARLELTSAAVRPLARRAIVVFTDGVPNVPLSGWEGTAGNWSVNAACDEARICRDLSLPIYTIGLSQNPIIEPIEAACLGDSSTVPPPAPGKGIARITGAMFVPVNDASKLNEAFEKIERSLVTLR